MTQKSYLFRVIGKPISRHLLETLIGYPYEPDWDLEQMKLEAFYRLCHLSDNTGLTMVQVAQNIEQKQMAKIQPYLPIATVREELLPRAAELIKLEFMPIWQIAVRFGVVTPALEYAMEKWRQECALKILRKNPHLTYQAVADRVRFVTGLPWQPSTREEMEPTIRLFMYAQEGGPVPAQNSGPEAAAFWQGYLAYPKNVEPEFPTKDLVKLFWAGVNRAKVESGLFRKSKRQRRKKK